MATSVDSGTALRCVVTRFLASARAKTGARPLARMPAMPPFTRLRRRMADRVRLLIFMIVDMARPPRRFAYENPILPAVDRKASPSGVLSEGKDLMAACHRHEILRFAPARKLPRAMTTLASLDL